MTKLDKATEKNENVKRDDEELHFWDGVPIEVIILLLIVTLIGVFRSI